MTHASPSASDPAWTANDLAGDPHTQTDKSRRVEQMFTAIAGKYDLNNRLHSFGRDQAWRRAAVRAARPAAQDDVLDVACGTGDLTEMFCTAGARSVVGADFTQAMLEIARVKAQRRRQSQNGGTGVPACVNETGGTPVPPHLVHSARRLKENDASAVCTPTYRHADATALPFDDAQFDIVSIAFGLRNIGDPAKALREFRRVLRPSGRLVVLEFSEPHNALIRTINALYCRRIMPITAALIARDRSGAYQYLPRSIETFPGPEALARELRSAGFTEVEVKPLTFGVCTITLGRVAGASIAVPAEGSHVSREGCA